VPEEGRENGDVLVRGGDFFKIGETWKGGGFEETLKSIKKKKKIKGTSKFWELRLSKVARRRGVK